MPTPEEILKTNSQKIEEARKGALTSGQFSAMKVGPSWYVEKRDENGVYRGSFYLSDREIMDLDLLLIKMKVAVQYRNDDQPTTKHECSDSLDGLDGVPERRAE